MENKSVITSSILMGINPSAQVPDSTLIVNKNIRTLEDLRKNFSPIQSSVLSEVRSFLPKLATANEDLQKRLQADPEYSADIEHLEDSDAPHIEMNLALVDADYSSEDSSLDSDTSTDDETEDHLMCGEVNENNIKMPKQGVKVTHGKQLICMVNETETKNTDSSSDSENHRPEAGT